MIETYSWRYSIFIKLLVEERSERPFVVLSLLKTIRYFDRKRRIRSSHTKTIWYHWILGNGGKFQDLGASGCWRLHIFISKDRVRWSEYGLVLAKKWEPKHHRLRAWNWNTYSYFKEKISWASPLVVNPNCWQHVILPISLTSQMPFLWSILPMVG